MVFSLVSSSNRPTYEFVILLKARVFPLERTLTAEEVNISSSSCELVTFNPNSLISAFEIVTATPLS